MGVERSPSRGAVFLSYASQDAAPARCICQALREAGVEVWFDQSELRGGDAWDQKIRRQIKDCTLFLPIISGNTQSRREGYFRLEWKLADDRTHLMAKGTPFLVPVCVDETKDWDALVPDSFMTVQWTRLPGGETPAAFVERIRHLLAGGTTPPMAARPAASTAPETAQPVPAPRNPPWLKALVATVAIVAFAFVCWYGLQKPPTPASEANAVAASAGPATTWPHDAELRRAIQSIERLDAIREDFLLAEEIARRAVEKSPSDPEAVTVLARVENTFLQRNFDFTDERASLARRYGERAVQLAPDEPEALAALAEFLTDRGGDHARAESLLRRACEKVPDQPRYWRRLSWAIYRQRRDEGLALAEQNAVRFSRDALTQYELSIFYRSLARYGDSERALDITLALAPVTNAMDWKARVALMHGDLESMRLWLDRMPERTRAEERSVLTRVAYARFAGNVAYGLAALQGFTETWFFDVNNYSGPKALLTASLYEQAGRPENARLQYESALAELRRQMEKDPANTAAHSAEVWVLRGLGRLDEARAASRANFESLRRPYRVNPLTLWNFDPILGQLLLGERANALQLLREAVTVPEGREAIRIRMRLDPRAAPFRDDPEIVALLGDAKPFEALPGKTSGKQ